MLLIGLLCAEPILSQAPAFDTSYVILSSAEYDYRNPSFYKCGSDLNYFIADALFAYEKWSSGTVSNIACRLITFNSMSPEVMLTSDQHINSKPAVAYFSDFSQPQNNKGAVVFESDRNGNKDVYFASFDGSAWSTAVNLTLSQEDERDPAIMPYGINGVYNYLTAYEKNGEIYLKNFFGGSWLDDICITIAESLHCITPEVTPVQYPEQSRFYIAYLKRLNDSLTSITYRYGVISVSGAISLISEVAVRQEGSQSNISFAKALNSWQLNYDYDTLGVKQFYSVAPYQNYYVITNNSEFTEGSNYCGTGSSHGDITGEMPVYAGICWLNRQNDTVSVIARKWGTFNFPKKFFAGTSGYNGFVNMSPKLVHQGMFRLRMIWESEHNGRTALYESYMDDNLSAIPDNEGGSPDRFRLYQNFPNPFNPVTTISYDLPNSGFVMLKVYDMLGREVKTLVNEMKTAGFHKAQFTAEGLATGAYFYRLSVSSIAGEFVAVKKCVVVK